MTWPSTVDAETRKEKKKDQVQIKMLKNEEDKEKRRFCQ